MVIPSVEIVSKQASQRRDIRQGQREVGPRGTVEHRDMGDYQLVALPEPSTSSCRKIAPFPPLKRVEQESRQAKPKHSLISPRPENL